MFEVLAREHGIDVILNRHVLVQNLEAIEIPGGVRTLVESFGTLAKRADAPVAQRVQAIRDYNRLHEYASALGESGLPEPAEIRRELVASLRDRLATAASADERLECGITLQQIGGADEGIRLGLQAALSEIYRAKRFSKEFWNRLAALDAIAESARGDGAARLLLQAGLSDPEYSVREWAMHKAFSAFPDHKTANVDRLVRMLKDGPPANVPLPSEVHQLLRGLVDRDADARAAISNYLGANGFREESRGLMVAMLDSNRASAAQVEHAAKLFEEGLGADDFRGRSSILWHLEVAARKRPELLDRPLVKSRLLAIVKAAPRSTSDNGFRSAVSAALLLSRHGSTEPDLLPLLIRAKIDARAQGSAASLKEIDEAFGRMPLDSSDALKGILSLLTDQPDEVKKWAGDLLVERASKSEATLARALDAAEGMVYLHRERLASLLPRIRPRSPRAVSWMERQVRRELGSGDFMRNPSHYAAVLWELDDGNALARETLHAQLRTFDDGFRKALEQVERLRRDSGIPAGGRAGLDKLLEFTPREIGKIYELHSSSNEGSDGGPMRALLAREFGSADDAKALLVDLARAEAARDGLLSKQSVLLFERLRPLPDEAAGLLRAQAAKYREKLGYVELDRAGSAAAALYRMGDRSREVLRVRETIAASPYGIAGLRKEDFDAAPATSCLAPALGRALTEF